VGRVVGIDLGTTNSVVAFWDGREPKVIVNREGSPLTPSVVSFAKNGQVLVGQVARRQAVVNAQTTVSHVKRLMGLTYAEAEKQANAQQLPIAAGPDGQVQVVVGAQQLAPEAISARVVESLREAAAAFLGEEVTGAVITVPAYFNDAQRQATREAGRLAGLEVLRIINEPTAAALAYGLERQGERRLAVYDLGGGTFDITILQSGDGLLEVLATAGDTRLGGQDIDQRVVAWLLGELERTVGLRLSPDKSTLQRLTDTAEQAKLDLSQRQEVDINLPFIGLHEGQPCHLVTVLSRALLEEMIADLVERTLTCCSRALEDARKRPGVLAPRPAGGSRRAASAGAGGGAGGGFAVDEVVLVGGSSRIPRVQEAVKKLFGKDPRRTVNPDEVVALGAAVQAALLAGDIQGITLSDVTPLSLGVERHDGTTSVLVPRNTPVPTRVVRSYSTADDNQAAVEIHVVQGEEELACLNRTLGRFALDNIAGGEAGDPEIQVTFAIDVDGIVHVEARDRTTGSYRAARMSAAEAAAPAAPPVSARGKGTLAERMAAAAAGGAGAAMPPPAAVPVSTPAATGPAPSSSGTRRALQAALKVLESSASELHPLLRQGLEDAIRDLEGLQVRSGSPQQIADAEAKVNELAARAVKSLFGRGRR
jgi:molecular chaperone DnaK